MSDASTKPDDTPAPEMRSVRALVALDVDGVRIAEGEVAQVRAELVDRLVEIGAAEETDAAPAAPRAPRKKG